VKSSSLRIRLFIVGTGWSVAASARTGIEVPLGWCTTSSGTSNNWPPYYGSYGTQGRLIAETDAGGALKRELIWLGVIPVGVVQ
jgi:hypothetical protein